MLELTDKTKLVLKWAFIFALLGAFSIYALVGSNYTLKRAVASTIEKQGLDLGTYNRLFILIDMNQSRFNVFGKKVLCEVGTVGHDALSSKYDLDVTSINVKGQSVDLLQVKGNSDPNEVVSDIQAASNVAPNCKPLDSQSFFYVIFTPHVS